MTMAAEYNVLYTHQKQKKAKVWQDGILQIASGCDKKATLFDDSGNRLEKVHIKSGKVEVGDEIESARHLITVEEVKVATVTSQAPSAGAQPSVSDASTRAAPVSRTLMKPNVGAPTGRISGGLPRTGLLKKKTNSLYNDEGNRTVKAHVKSGQGFIPPRIVKRPRLDEDENEEATQSSLSSAAINTSCPPKPGTPPNIFSLYGQHRSVEPEKEAQIGAVSDSSVSDLEGDILADDHPQFNILKDSL